MSENAVLTFVPSIIQETLPGYHDAVFYWCRFSPILTCKDTDRLVLYFGAADYKADVYVNGVFLGSHEGGETPFSFDVTGIVKQEEENLLAVRIVNPIVEDIDELNIVNVPNRNKAPVNMAGASTNHGGLWGEVSLRCISAVFLEDVYYTR
ncbi:MAG: hypothetical protein IKC46_14135 [Lachnospiraceae bacterium]|nr:hypothetical protein [Lachnospiraceae bacterium]